MVFPERDGGVTGRAVAGRAGRVGGMAGATGGRDGEGTGGGLAAGAGRDAYVAAQNQTFVNNDNRRVEAGAVPDPAVVVLSGRVQGLPRPAARVFEGRVAALGALGGALAGRGGALVTQAVFGLGGVGKSELALQYAHAHRGDYGLVWWITATDGAALEAGLAELANRLCPAVAVLASTAEAAGWAAGWLQSHEGWLLVLDNVEDPADVEPLLGQLGDGGHVIVTSRRDADWGRLAAPVRLGVLDAAAAVRLLGRRTGRDSAADLAALREIAAELGFLPLGLEQAAAYMARQRVAPAAYLQSLQEQPARMHAAGAGAGAAAQRVVARLWDLHIAAIRAQVPLAARLLGVLARFAPDAVPRVMVVWDATREDIDEALGLLASYSMVTLTADAVSVHRLLQAVILAQDGPDEDRRLLDEALDWLHTAIPGDPRNDMAGWPLLRTLAPHAEALTARYPPGTEPERLAVVQNEIAMFLASQGEYTRALPLAERALAIIESALGPDHPDTALRLGNLAVTYSDLGRVADALPLAQRALAITEAALGPDHPDTALRLGNLALTLGALGRAADALPLEERALAIMEAALGPDHPDTALRLGNLAGTYSDLGRSADALPLAERALAITEAALGPDHPDMALRLGNLAVTYSDLGRSADALPLKERALAITEATLGPDHPDTALRLGNLALTLGALGRAADALPLEERALAITEAALGPDHPDTALRLNNLAVTYSDLGRAADALPLKERALAITEVALGPGHPDMALRLGNLAVTYSDLGRAADALPLEERALAITEAALGPGHPDMALRLGNLAVTYSDLGRPADALPLEERALAITEAALGADHPTTGRRLGNLAATYRDLGREAEALRLEERARQAMRRLG